MSTSTFRPLSDVHGRIEEILLTTTEHDPRYFINRFKGLFRALPPHVQYIVLAGFPPSATGDYYQTMSALTAQGKQAIAAEGMQPSQLSQVILNPVMDYCKLINSIVRPIVANQIPCASHTITYRQWAQDPFCVLEYDCGISALLEPMQIPEFDGRDFGDQYIADHVAAMRDYVIKPFPYVLAGGNILAGDGYILVGTDIIRQNRLFFPNISKQDIENALISAFGVPCVIWIDQSTPTGDQTSTDPFPPFEPITHIDRYITLGGQTDDGQELVFVGKVVQINTSSDPVAQSIAQQYSQYVDATARSLKNCTLNGAKFKVVRIPLILEIMERSPAIIRSYNNCLVEVYDGVKNVYLPRYFDKYNSVDVYAAVERETIDTFRRHGFQVSMVDGPFMAISEQQGGLRCIAKVLRRSRSRGKSLPAALPLYGNISINLSREGLDFHYRPGSTS